MKEFDQALLKKLSLPTKDSHKGQNGKLMIIGGSHLFHGASLWALQVASRIVDMVYYSSVPENNQLVLEAKKEFRNGIVVPRDKIDSYIEEADCILIGPGLPRPEGEEQGDDNTKELTDDLLKKYPTKKWVIDGGSLQTIDPSLIPQNAILTPHRGELAQLFRFKIQDPTGTFGSRFKIEEHNTELDQELVSQMAKEYHCTIVLKGREDIICSKETCVIVTGGNPGMTKGGTGDVLAGLIAALACKNDPFLAAATGSYLNKKAGESLSRKVGPFFNASDLASALPGVMKELLT